MCAGGAALLLKTTRWRCCRLHGNFVARRASGTDNPRDTFWHLTVQRGVSGGMLTDQTNNHDQILTKLTASSTPYFLQFIFPVDLVEAHDEVEDSFDDVGICDERNERELSLWGFILRICVSRLVLNVFNKNTRSKNYVLTTSNDKSKNTIRHTLSLFDINTYVDVQQRCTIVRWIRRILRKSSGATGVRHASVILS